MVTLDSWKHIDHGAEPDKIFRVGKTSEKNALLKEMKNKGVLRVRSHNPRNRKQVKYLFFRLDNFIGTDRRHESQIPDSHKSQSKDQGGHRVPLRHAFSVSPLVNIELKPKEDMGKWEKFL